MVQNIFSRDDPLELTVAKNKALTDTQFLKYLRINILYVSFEISKLAHEFRILLNILSLKSVIIFELTSTTKAIGETSETFIGAISKTCDRRAIAGSPGF